MQCSGYTPLTLISWPAGFTKLNHGMSYTCHRGARCREHVCTVGLPYSALQAHLHIAGGMGAAGAGLPDGVGAKASPLLPTASVQLKTVGADHQLQRPSCCQLSAVLCATKSAPAPAGVPYDLTPEFLNELFTKHRIDYVIHGDDPCLLPDGTDAYEHAKKMGRFRMVGCSKPSQALGRSQRSPVRAQFTWGIQVLCCILEVCRLVCRWH